MATSVSLDVKVVTVPIYSFIIYYLFIQGKLSPVTLFHDILWLNTVLSGDRVHRVIGGSGNGKLRRG